MKQKLVIIAIIAAIAAIGYLLYLLFEDKPQPDNHKSDYTELKSDNDTLKVHLAASEKRYSDLYFSAQ